MRSAAVELPDIRPPGRPVITDLEAGEGFVTIRWIAPVDDDVEGFDVIRRDRSGSETVVGKGVSDTEFADRDVLIGAFYQYRVEAFDEVGNRSEASDELTQRIVGGVDARPPSNLQVRTRGGKRSLAWRPIEGYADMSYVVVAANSNRGPFLPVGAPTEKAEFVLPRGLDRADQLWFAVVARYFNGDVSAASTPIQASGSSAFGGK